MAESVNGELSTALGIGVKWQTSMSDLTLPEGYIQWVLQQRKSKLLHKAVEERLAQLLNRIAPDLHPIKEVQGLAGGRNDLLAFEFTGKKVLFEIIATKSQVSRDLRILDKTVADIKIAVIIDKEADPKVFDRFSKENPENNYPFIFIGELFVNPLTRSCAFKLYELIRGDEEAKFQRILNQKISARDFFKMCKEEGIEILSPDDLASKNVTFRKVLMMLLVGKLADLGINKNHTKKLLKWMSDEKLFEFVVMKIQHGFNTFLYTDMNETMAIYSDIELLDWIRASHMFPQAHILISLNSLFYEILDKYLKDSSEYQINREIRFTIGHSEMHQSEGGRAVIFSIPTNTKQIVVFRPMTFGKKGDGNVLKSKDYLKMIEII